MYAITGSAIDFKRFGRLAYVFCGKRLELIVLKSNAGFYIGTADDDGPCSRESVEYFHNKDDADASLASGDWTQKPNP